MPVFILSSYAHKEVFGTLLTAGAIASPLFGTIAGLHQQRWRSAPCGCAIGLILILALFAAL